MPATHPFLPNTQARCIDSAGATAFLKSGATYTIRTIEPNGSVTLAEVVAWKLSNEPAEDRCFHPHFGARRFEPVYECGCAPWRPNPADTHWHLSTCGIAPAPTSLRIV